MVEKKIKKAETSSKAPSSAKKTTSVPTKKPASLKKTPKSESKSTVQSKPKSKSASKTIKPVLESSMQNKATKAIPENKTFSTRNLAEKKLESPRPEKKAPTWIVLVFIFSVVFFLFSLYKVFVYKEGYFSSQPISLPLPLQTGSETGSLDQESQTGIVGGGQSSSTPETNLMDGELMFQDAQLIQNFYSYLTNNQIEEMNALVDRPLKNSITRANHWNKKNIKIFTKHLSDTVLLQDIFLVPNSSNPEKKSRQYSYTLKYTISPEHAFTEEWELTLVTRGEQTLISEIMCKTEGCSHSPFFWPQNYGLK